MEMSLGVMETVRKFQSYKRYIILNLLLKIPKFIVCHFENVFVAVKWSKLLKLIILKSIYNVYANT